MCLRISSLDLRFLCSDDPRNCCLLCVLQYLHVRISCETSLQTHQVAIIDKATHTSFITSPMVLVVATSAAATTPNMSCKWIALLIMVAWDDMMRFAAAIDTSAVECVVGWTRFFSKPPVRQRWLPFNTMRMLRYAPIYNYKINVLKKVIWILDSIVTGILREMLCVEEEVHREAGSFARENRASTQQPAYTKVEASAVNYQFNSLTITIR